MNPQPVSNPPAKTSTNPVRRHCKIARLPAESRELLNGMLRDGASYSAIIKTFQQRGHRLDLATLSRWHAGGFKDWLREQAWLDEMRARLDFASVIVKEPNAELLDQASLRIAVTRMYTLLTQFDPATLLPKLAENPGAYVRILNALCHLTETALKLQRSSDEKTNPAPALHISATP
jgi:hypothetical protein